MVDLSEPYSNTFLKFCKFKDSHADTADTPDRYSLAKNKSVNKYGETEIKRIRQKQKILSKYEVQEVIQLYLNRVSANSIAASLVFRRASDSYRNRLNLLPFDDKIEIEAEKVIPDILSESIIRGTSSCFLITLFRTGL